MAELLPLCLFCLDEMKENQSCPNLIGCECEVNCHPSCLQDWFQQKQQMECPICHVVLAANPLHRIEPPREYVIVRLQNIEHQEHRNRIRLQDKCIGFCCLTILLWWIGGLVLEFGF